MVQAALLIAAALLAFLRRDSAAVVPPARLPIAARLMASRRRDSVPWYRLPALSALAG